MIVKFSETENLIKPNIKNLRTKIKGFAASGMINPQIAKIQRKEDKKVSKPKGLSKKQIAFCKEYIKDHNGSQAAVRAGYAEKNSRITASQYLTISNIQNKI
jgi:response regulator of citrate/malate metabolism